MGWRWWDSHYSQGRVWSVECSISVCKSCLHSAARNSFSRPEFHLISERSSGRGYKLQHRATWLPTIIPLSTSQFIIHLVNGVISQLLSRSLIGFHYGMHYLFNFYQFGFCSWSLLPVVSHPADINDCSKDYNNSCTNILSWWGGSGINLFFLCCDEEQNWASDKWTGDNLDKTEINHQNTK